MSIPIISWFSFKGRVRTNYSENNPTTQFRGGIQVTVPITDNVGVYAQAYNANKINFKGRQSDVKTGAYGGIEIKINNRIKFFVEVQPYDLHHPKRDNIGVNSGLRVSL